MKILSQNDLDKDTLLEIIKLHTEVAQQGMDIANIMDIVVQKTQLITNSDGASMELIEKSEIVSSAASGIAEKFLGLRLDIDISLSGECIRKRIPLISNNIEIDDRVNKNVCRQIGVKSMIVLPLICNNIVVGVLKVLSRKTNHYSEEEISILELMTGLIAAEVFNALKNDNSELLYKATHDSLTGISNRSLFYDRLRQKLSRALRKNEEFGVISLDMDGLKEINDNYGHRAGDAAIKEIASRIKNTIDKLDTVSRLGGDEFGIIVSNVTNRSDIISLINRIEYEVIKPFEFENFKIKLMVSIGYAHFKEDGIDIEVLIEKADKSMYEIKRKRKGLGNIR